MSTLVWDNPGLFPVFEKGGRSSIIRPRVAIGEGMSWMKQRSGTGPDEATSVELARRARDGDRQALDLLYRRHAPVLRQWAAGRLPRWARDALDTEDIIQDAMLRTFNQLEHFQPRGDGAMQAYLRQALRNRITDEVRKLQRRPKPTELDETQAAADASPLEETIGHEALERYERALECLSEADREAIVARVELCLPYDEIARNLGKSSPDAARMAVGRALVRLAKEME